jgi:hypothetical protein
MNVFGRLRRGIFPFLLTVVLLLGGRMATAQLDTGSLGGTVTDTTGAAIPGAHLTAIEQTTKTAYKTTSSSTGEYVFPSLKPGVYIVTAEAPEFSKEQVTSLPIYVSTRASKDFKLTVGQDTQTVTVDADGPTLETETSDIGTVITPQQVDELPIESGGAIRSLTQLIFLTPGAVGPGTNGGTTYTKIGGGQTEGSDLLIDGVSTFRSENGSGYFDQDTPNPDVVDEFKVETLSLPSYFGRTTGGVANFKTASGTNDYHGTVWDYFRNKIFDSNNWFSKGQAIQDGTTQNNPLFQRPVDTHNDYGVTLGGPVRIPFLYNGKDKTFFLFGFNQVPNKSGYTSIAQVPTLAERGLTNGSNGTIADFSAYLTNQNLGPNGAVYDNPCNGQPMYYGAIYDPSTTKTVTQGGTVIECRSAFTNNQVPISTNPVVQKLLKLIPLPNYTTSGTQNYRMTGSLPNTNTVYTLQVDQNLGTRNHLYFFGSHRENSSAGQPNLPGPIDSGSNNQDLFSEYIRLGWAFTITPRFVNTLTFGGNRTNSYNDAPIAQSGTNWDSTLGIANTPQPGPTFPVINIGNGITSLGSPNFDDNADNALILDDMVSWQKGHHGITFGGLYRWQQFSYVNSGPAAGTFNFASTQTAGVNQAVGGNPENETGNSIASFLLGDLSSSSRTVQLQAPRWLSYYWAAYIQDDWKVRNGLTLNLGFRYSIDTPRHEADGDISSFSPTVMNPEAGILGGLKFGGVGPGRDGNKNETFAQTYKKNFEPRIGFAYAPDFWHEKVVVRGNYSIMYGPVAYSDYGQGLNAGFTVNTPAANNDPFVGSGTIDAGPLSVPTTPNVDPGQLNNETADYVFPGDGRPGMVQNYSLEFQTQLAPDLILTTGFLGERGTHLRGLTFWPNSLNPGYFGLGNLIYQPITSPAAQAAGIPIPFPNFIAVTGGNDLVGQALEPFPQMGYLNNDSYLQNHGQSTYDALEVKLDRKFRSGLSLLLSYTWSKTLTDADSIQPYYATVLGQGGTQNPYDLKAEKCVSTQDVPTNFVASYLYELPVGKGKKFLGNSNKFVNALVGGYRIGGINRYLSGQPVSFYGATGVGYFDGGIRYNLKQGVDFETPAGASKHYNPLSFQPIYTGLTENPTAFWNASKFIDENANVGAPGGPTGFTFGNDKRNDALARQAAYFNEDLNLNKHFNIVEGVGADLRFDLFDAFNRHGFGKPNTGVSSPTSFGQITYLNEGPRTAQLVLKIKF